LSEEDIILHSVGGPQANLLHTMPRNYDDMYDSEGDLKRWPRLAPILQDCETTVGVALHKADLNARRYEVLYKRLVYMAAILLAVVQLSLIMVELPWWGSIGDFVAAISAVVAAFTLIARRRGIPSGRLEERKKAERYRLLKFWFLTEVRPWSGSTSKARQDFLRGFVERFSTLNNVDLMYSVVGEGKVFEVPSLAQSLTTVDEELLHELVDYYQEKRLNHQIMYLEIIARRSHLWDRLTQNCSTLFFWLGILAALAYFTYNLSMHMYFNPNSYSGDALSSALLLSTACLSLVGATVDQFLKAGGFVRPSAIRSRVASHELKQLASELQTVASARGKLKLLQRVEKFFDALSRENLRSAIEARISESGT
jgi:hypothetical protein